MKKSYFNTSTYLKSLAAAFLLLSGLVPIHGQAQSITLLSPNGGEAWVYGTMEEVSWVGDGLSSMLRLEFSPDGGNTWGYFAEVPSAPDGGIFPVNVPNYNSTNALLRITDFSNPSVNDISDAPFTVTVPAINIYQPATGSVVFANTLTYVNWIVYAPGISQLNAEISTDNGLTYIPVAQNLNALMGYTYLVLSDTPAETAILKLYNALDPSEFCLSTPFTISQVPVYTLTSPSGGEIVNVYSPVTISWTVENPYSDNCDLEYSTDNGETWAFINNATSTGTFGSYVWTTPNLNSEECVIRIRDIYAFTSMDTSAAFTIMPFPETPLCLVTVDSLTNYNVIVWEKPVSGLIDDFLVYRETAQANVYEVIDTVGYNEEPLVTDFGSNPAVRPYRYKVGFIDNENRVFPAGDYHQTIHLTISQGVGGSWNLNWTPYTGFDFSTYKILRKTGTGSYEQITTISSSFSSFTDFDAPSGDIAYIVAIDRPGVCNTSLRDNGYKDVRSNAASLNTVSVAGSKEVDFSVYPVPANDRISVQFGEKATGTINLTITDVTGRIIYSGEYSDVRPGQVYSVSTSEYTEGLYLMNVISAVNRSIKKIVVRH
ncbi:MAG: T9SS type A sorting domain-containing protein [Lentimicrobium sp.]